MDQDIKTLVKALKDKLSSSALIVTAESKNYRECIRRWSAAAEKPAAIIVFPALPGDVSTTILLTTKSGMELAVCGGGHATSGSSSTDGGVCIDLSEMRAVSVDPKSKIVTAQGGCLWADVDKAAEEHGLAVVGGTVNSTGVGGLSLGGGLGYLVGQHGLVIDNLLEVEMVLADGKIVTASRHKGKRLFWAVRGAGASFGVVTSFTYLGHEQKTPVWGGTLVLKISQLDKVVAFANKFLEISDPRSALIWGFKALSPDNLCLVATVFFNGQAIHAKALFAPLLELDVLEDSTVVRPYSSMNSLFNADFKAGYRRSMKGSVFIPPLDLKFAEKFLQEFGDFVLKTPDAFMSMMIFEFFPFKKIIQVPHNDTAFANRGAYGNVLWIAGWTKEEHDEECREWTRHMSREARMEFERSKMTLRKDGVTEYGVGEYFNYDGIGIGGKEVFGDNFDKLAAQKLKFDPNNIFCKGPQLLSKSP